MRSKDGDVLVELMDIESANLIGSYRTEDEALEVVRAAITQFGQPYVYTWALGWLDQRTPALIGAQLARRALTKIQA
jgi:hypothetical protein